MSLSEFGIIEHYFSRQRIARADVALGVGDDCALLRVPLGQALAVSIDTLVEGRHFPPDTAPRAVGHKALAVGLSDLAAMGAEPAWATLALSLPAADETWLADFATGLFTLAEAHGVQLVGGDTVQGPRVITLQLHGFVPEAGALRRAGAAPGDRVYVTGTLGDAGAGLALVQGRLPPAAEGDRTFLQDRLDCPQPRVVTGLALRGLASAAIDISDGLAADLGHILAASGVGAELDLARLPLSASLGRVVPEEAVRWRQALTAGDDYELCFTVPPHHQAEVERRCADLPGGAVCIGTVVAEPGLRLLLPDGGTWALEQDGFDHFRAPQP